ncbi:S1 family peptidase [Streptomyces sp. NPDC003077]|uniref:S1 family peptidase n=1 Tax=Streptomyces sp. NPDC003077 TaxID=3154443 RepID=UPI0033B78C64
METTRSTESTSARPVRRSAAVRRAVLTGAAALTLAVGDLGPAPAGASPAPAPSAAAPYVTPAELVSRLPVRTAGWYYAKGTGKPVVNVLDAASARAVRAKGGEARVVRHSLAELDDARRTLKADATIPGTSWSADPRSNKIQVTADRTVKGARLARLTEVVARLGDKAHLRKVRTTFRPFIAGGDAIWGTGHRCSLGFNVVKDGRPYFLTAGHCGKAVREWSAEHGGTPIGVTEQSSFPGVDHALVKYTSRQPHPSEVDLHDGTTQRITRAGEAEIGQDVRSSGSTTGVQDGVVTGLDETVNYEEGTVEGLIRATMCAKPGDSGGALFADDVALGLTSGGTGTCADGGETFFQPVPKALGAYGARIG